VPFAADDLGAWLVGLLADAGRRKLVAFVLGDEQERALHGACQAALTATAADLCTGNAADAEQFAMVVGEVFAAPAPEADGEHGTLLEALQGGIAARLAVLDDRDITAEPGWSSADVLGVPAGLIAEKLASHLVREITGRGARGGPLEPLANQLAHDRGFLLGLRLEGKVDHLDDMLASMLAALDPAGPPAAIAAPVALAQLPAEPAVFTGRDDELALLAGLLDPAGAAAPLVVSAVAGLAGVGKTTLSVAAAHAAVQAGWFGGGCCFLTCTATTTSPCGRVRR